MCVGKISIFHQNVFGRKDVRTVIFVIFDDLKETEFLLLTDFTTT